MLVIARSTLLILLVLALIQVALAVPAGPFLFTHKRANGVLKTRYSQSLSVKRDDLQGDPLVIKLRAPDYGVIQTTDGTNFVTDRNFEGILEPTMKYWSFEEAGEEFCMIKVPKNDMVLD